MAIYTPTIDYNATAGVISRDNMIRQSELNTRNQELNYKSLDLQGESLELNKQSLQLQKAEMWTSAILDSVKIGMGLWDQAKVKTEQSQFETAKNQVTDSSTQFAEMVAESVLNGNTQLTQTPEGVWDIQMDQGLINWKDTQLKAIENSKDTPKVKAWKSQSINHIYESGSSQILSGVLNQSQKTIDQQYNLNIGKSIKTDVSLSSGDNRSYENGVGLINSRTDMSPQAKAVQVELYKQSVDKQVDGKNINAIAAAQGISAATTAAYKLEGYTPEEIQSFVATAAKTDQQLAISAATTVSNVMSQGLEAGKNASDLWTEVEKAVQKLPEDRRQVALDTAKSAQVEFATGKATQMWVNDADVDLGTLQERRDSIKDGALASQLFYNIPETQKNFVTLYDKQIAAVQKVQGTVSDEMVKMNKTSASSVYKQFEQGSISGNNAIASLMAIGQNTANMEDDVYAMDFLNKIKDNAVPPKFKPAADSFLKQMDSLNWGISGDRDDFTPEQEGQLANAKQWAYGMIADVFLSTASNSINDGAFADTLTNIKRIYTSDVLDVTRSATINSKSATDDMANLGYNMGANKTVFFDDVSGQIKWADKSIKTAFDKVSGQFNNELSELGVKVKAAPHPLVIGDEVFPIPQLKGTEQDGVARLYTLDRSDVFSSEDNGATWERRWTLEDSKLDDTKFLSSELKKEKTEINNYFDQFRNVIKKEDPKPSPAPKPKPSNIKTPDTTPQEDADRMDRTNAAQKPTVTAVNIDDEPKEVPKKAEEDRPKTSPKEEQAAVDQDNKILSKLDKNRQNLLKSRLKTWVISNPTKEPSKSDLPQQYYFASDEMIAAMYRQITRERKDK